MEGSGLYSYPEVLARFTALRCSSQSTCPRRGPATSLPNHRRRRTTPSPSPQTMPHPTPLHPTMSDEGHRLFSCKCRYFCPTCHAKRLALWGIWLEDSLLAEVPHRQVVLAVPKRLRSYFLYHRSLLGDLSRVAARSVTAFIRATLGERDLSVGIVSSIQTHGSLANWHPHLHMLVTDGGFRPDGTFVRLPLHDVATLTEAFRRAVLKLFVKRELMDVETAQGMLAWSHSGSHVHDGVRVAADERDFAVRLARYCARNPPRGARPHAVPQRRQHRHLPLRQSLPDRPRAARPSMHWSFWPAY